MAGDNHGIEKTQDAKATENDGYEQTQESQSQVNGVDREKAIAERDEKIAALEQQMTDAAKTAEAAEALRGEIAELKAQGESDHIDFKLQLAGVRNVKSARAILVDHGGDVDKLKEAGLWLFADAPAPQQGGKTGLPNAGTSSDEGKTMRRWRKLAGLDDTDDK